MNQFKIAFIALLIGLFTSGCYTVVYLTDEEDEYVEEVAYVPPTQPYIPPAPPYLPGPPERPIRPPVQPPVINPIIIIHPPIAPPPPEYKTRPPENDGGDKKRDPGVIRNGGGRGKDGSRR